MDKDGQPEQVFWIYSTDDLIFERAGVLGKNTRAILTQENFGPQDRAICMSSQPCNSDWVARKATAEEVGPVLFQLVDKAKSRLFTLQRVIA